jgi:nucleoside-diphosphate-sugar epimerase
LLSGEKILVTGPAGNIAFPLCRELAKHNEVWGAARFSSPDSRAKVEAIGVKPVQVDLADGDFKGLPDDFSYVLHLAASTGPGQDYDAAIRTNAEATGLLLAHCRKAKAAMVMSTASVYRPHPDPWHAFVETDAVGDANVPGSPTYGISKTMEEGVARAMARHLGLPVVIARMNVAYGDTGGGGLPGYHFETIRAGKPVTLRWDPIPYSPIHDRDIFDQLPALLGQATVPATIVNWGGDVVVTAQQWCAHFGELLGVAPTVLFQEVPNSQRGSIFDNTRRLAVAGPCRVDWRDGFRELAEAHLRR